MGLKLKHAAVHCRLITSEVIKVFTAFSEVVRKRLNVHLIYVHSGSSACVICEYVCASVGVFLFACALCAIC